MKQGIQNIVAQLREGLQHPLPGKVVHQKMLPPDRLLEPPPENGTVIQSSVLLLLYPDDERLKLVFIRRPGSMKNHAGQIAFPGGRFEAEDENLQQTALREAAEEIGINRDHIEIIGELSPLYVVVSNYTIHAFVGYSPVIPSFELNYNEVEELFTIPVDTLRNLNSIQNKKVNTIYGVQDFPGYLVEDIFIWGATGMILTEFLEVYNKI